MTYKFEAPINPEIGPRIVCALKKDPYLIYKIGKDCPESKLLSSDNEDNIRTCGKKAKSASHSEDCNVRGLFQFS